MPGVQWPEGQHDVRGVPGHDVRPERVHPQPCECESQIVFHEHSILQVKAEWAFKVFDFDGDGKLNKDDIYRTVSALTDLDHTESPETLERLEREKVE